MVEIKDTNRTPPFPNWLLLAILLAGAFLRCAALGAMEDMLHYDEAYNGVDALSLLQYPRLTPFLPGNYGRESGWCYILTLFIALFGVRPFSLRLAAALVSVLTLVASYALGKELFGRRGATLTAAALAVLYWSVHLSHLALRANLLPLVGTLAFAALLHAQRTNALRWWVIGGLCTGLLGYTYYSAYFWILYAFVLLAWWAVGDREKRRGAGLALLIAMLVLLPMGSYALSHREVLARPGMVGVFGPREVWNNMLLWARAWFQQGDPNAEFNLPGRPILDLWLGILFLLGLASLPSVTRRRWHGLWVVGLALCAVLPSLLSDQVPHFLRAVGLTIPIALTTGAGAGAVERVTRRLAGRAVAALLPLALLTMSGIATYRDFYGRWLNHPEVFIFMEKHIYLSLIHI